MGVEMPLERTVYSIAWKRRMRSASSLLRRIASLRQLSITLAAPQQLRPDCWNDAGHARAGRDVYLRGWKGLLGEPAAPTRRICQRAWRTLK